MDIFSSLTQKTPSLFVSGYTHTKKIILKKCRKKSLQTPFHLTLVSQAVSQKN